MDESTTVGQSTSASASAAQPNVRVYSLPEHGFARHRTGVMLQVVFLGLFAIALGVVLLYFTFATSTHLQALAILLGVGGFLFLVFGILIIPGAQRRLWRQVKVEVDDHYVMARHKGAPVDVRLLPQLEIRVEREQVTAIRETPYGLVIATRYDPQALVIPVQLDDADYREIIATLSAWCTIQRRPAGARGAVSGVLARLADRAKLAHSNSLFYDRGNGVFAAGVLVGTVAGVLPGLFIVIRWSRGRQVPTDLALVIVAAYVITMLGTIIGSCIAFGWLDYGLARIGMRRPTRSAVWAGAAAAVMISAFPIAAGLDLLVGLIIIVTGTLLSAGLGWLVATLQVSTEPALESCALTEQELSSYAATVNSESDSPILGAYRLTFDEFYMAVGYSTMTQPVALQ